MGDEKKKTLGRRGFLKGAAIAGVAAAVPASGLLVQKLGAQGQQSKIWKRSDIKEPPGVVEDRDIIPLAESIANTAFEAAYDAFNAAVEEVVKGKDKEINTQALLKRQGLKLHSKEAKATARTVKVPPSILKIREMQLKQQGWHAHGTVCLIKIGSICVGYGHAHVTW